MTYAAIVLLLTAAALRTRLARATFAFVLMRLSNRLYIVGYRVLENLQEDFHG